jgi:hypothetical protein
LADLASCAFATTVQKHKKQVQIKRVLLLSCLLILPSISAQLLASCAQLASYLCLLIYVTFSIYACLFAPKGQISKHKATKGCLKHQRCLKEMLAYG